MYKYDEIDQTNIDERVAQYRDQVRRYLAGELTEDEFRPLRLRNGLYIQRHAPMFRIAVPYGLLASRQLRKLGESLNRWVITPNGSEGYKKAEVTRGGVDTRELSQQSMMANKVPGLHVIGESVDVTGWLGGYNFQWAWASGVATGLSL